MAGELSAVAVRPGSAVRGADRSATAWLLLAPSCLALALLFVVPIAYVLVLSVSDPQLSLAHYRRIFTVPVYTRVMVNTFVTSLIVTALCLVIGYPIAYVMARRAGWMSTVLLTIVAMSFWTGFLVRTYAWLVILGSKGPVAAAYGALGLGAAPQLLFNTFSSTLGMTHILLPYMILALYATMKKIDVNHLKAAASLGARPAATFREVSPVWVPLPAFDLRREWVGPYPWVPGATARVTAAWWRGRPVSFSVRGPWDRPLRMEAARVSIGSMLSGGIVLLLITVTIVFASVIGRRRLVGGRGDWRGGARLGGFMLVCRMLQWAAVG